MSEKRTRNYLILSCLLNPPSLVSTKETCIFIRDSFNVRSEFLTNSKFLNV